MSLNNPTKLQIRHRWMLAALIVLGYLIAINLYLGGSKTQSAEVEKRVSTVKTKPAVVAPQQLELTKQADLDTPFPIHRAIELNNYRRLVELLSEPDQLTAIDSYGNTALHVAVARRQFHVAAALLLMGADPVAQNNDGKAPLFLLPSSEISGSAIHFLKLLQSTLWHAGDPHQTTKEKFAQATFYIAAVAADAELVAQAVALGADINRPLTPDGRVALHYARSTQSFELLVQIGSTINLQDESGDTPLMTVAREGWTPQVLVLLKANAEVNVHDNRGQSALKQAIDKGRDGYPRVVVELLNYGAEMGFAEWIAAVSKRSAKVLQTIFDHGAEFSAQSADGQKILNEAQKRGGPGIEELLQAHPKIGLVLWDLRRQQEQERQTAMQNVAKAASPHVAFHFGTIIMVTIVVALLMGELMASPWRRLIVAVLLSVVVLYLLLLPMDVQEVVVEIPFMGAPIGGIGLIVGGVVVLLATSLAVFVVPTITILRRADATGKSHSVLLGPWAAGAMLALLVGVALLHHTELIRILDKVYLALTGASIEKLDDESSAKRQLRRTTKPAIAVAHNNKYTDPESNRTWFDNVSSNRLELVEEALNRGHDPNTTDKKGYTALHRAVHQRNYQTLVALLLDHSANPNAPDKRSKLPLCIALRFDRRGEANAKVHTMADLLLKHGASIRHPQCAPIQIAKSRETIQWLLHRGADLEGTMQYGSGAHARYGRITSLMRAVLNSDLAKLQYLLAEGAVVDARESTKGFTAMQVALAQIRYNTNPSANSKAIVNTLLAAGADTQTVAYDGTDTRSLDQHGLLEVYTRNAVWAAD